MARTGILRGAIRTVRAARAEVRAEMGLTNLREVV